MKILLLDNYDSFTYNLLHYLEQFATVEVKRNDEITVQECKEYDKIVISPGPGLPSDAGITMQLIAELGSTKPMLGVCLGMQAIVESFDGELVNMPTVLHGKSTTCELVGNDSLFNGIPKNFDIGRYHSWAVRQSNIPDELEVLSIDDSGYVMALRHKTYDLMNKTHK